MSMIHNHKLIGGIRLVPSLYGNFASNGLASGTYIVTPNGVTPEGLVMVITLGGNQTRTVTGVPSGFTEVAHGVNTTKLYWKISGASEPTDYTFTFGASLSGGWYFYALTDVDLLSPILSSFNNAALGVTTLSPAASGYDITLPAFAIAQLSKSGSASWSADNGYTTVLAVGGHSSAFKVFSVPALAENVNFSGVIQDVVSGLVIFKGKLIN